MTLAHAPPGCAVVEGEFSVVLDGAVDDAPPPLEGADADVGLGMTEDALVLAGAANRRARPVRFAMPTTRKKLLADAADVVERLGLWREDSGDCEQGDRACVARSLADVVERGGASSSREQTPARCRAVLDRPRAGEVLVLGHVDAEVGVEVWEAGAWRWLGPVAGEVHVDARPGRASAR